MGKMCFQFYTIWRMQLNDLDRTLRICKLQVVFCRILGALFCYGYDVVTSTDVARDCLTHCAAFFRLREPHDNWKLRAYSHKFICVAPYGADQLLLINIPKVAVEEIYKVRERHACTMGPTCRSARTVI